jgi:segregation and condensation protein A
LKADAEPKVLLPVFEGPLDLLLYLIKRDELDIYDIPIERVTRQYQEYLSTMKILDLEIAGEFLVMASTLLYIKSRMLLPKDQQPPEDEAQEDDPRWELIRQLIEYKKFKDAAEELKLRQMEQEKRFLRGAGSRVELEKQVYKPGEAGVFDLITAFQRVLQRITAQDDLKEIFEDRFTVSDKINYIRELLAVRSEIMFGELFRAATSRTEVVVTFLALLELIRLKQLRATQEENFGEIRLVRSPDFPQMV